ncbi:hypothetical protein [Cytobacillus oceanisediminis]|nr:hypothetical protein [Cytobacillus oceanisediminis]
MASRQGNSKKWSKGGPSVEERVKELVSVLDEGVKNFEFGCIFKLRTYDL